MSKGIFKTAAFMILTLALLVGTARVSRAGEPVLDQSFVVNQDLGSSINECCAVIAQTFTAGITGTLDGVNVNIWAGNMYITSQLHISINSVVDGFPTTEVLGAVTLPSAGSSLSEYVHFTDNIQVVAGTQYAILASYVNAPPPGGGMGQGGWGGATGDLYAGGTMMALDGSNWIFSGAGYDLLFQTYVVPAVVDNDGDGFDETADCDDNDASVYPGASEVKFDGVDQDCNGYDLTIDIIKADYGSSNDSLKVDATTDLQSAGALELAEFGPMTWKKQGKWTIVVTVVGGSPGTVSVCGVEGCDSVEVSVQ